jgi:hypothetical protein
MLGITQWVPNSSLLSSMFQEENDDTADTIVLPSS